jgi:hypothetical protein
MDAGGMWNARISASLTDWGAETLYYSVLLCRLPRFGHQRIPICREFLGISASNRPVPLRVSRFLTVLLADQGYIDHLEANDSADSCFSLAINVECRSGSLPDWTYVHHKQSVSAALGTVYDGLFLVIPRNVAISRISTNHVVPHESLSTVGRVVEVGQSACRCFSLTQWAIHASHRPIILKPQREAFSGVIQ